MREAFPISSSLMKKPFAGPVLEQLATSVSCKEAATVAPSAMSIKRSVPGQPRRCGCITVKSEAMVMNWKGAVARYTPHLFNKNMNSDAYPNVAPLPD